MAGKEGRTCVPGEVIARVPRDGGPAGTTVRLGSGTSQNKCGRAGASTLAIRTTKAGTLKQQGKREVKRFWVETRHQRYVPSMDALVVGIVMECHGETYSVDVSERGQKWLCLPHVYWTTNSGRDRLETKISTCERRSQLFCDSNAAAQEAEALPHTRRSRVFHIPPSCFMF